MRSRGGLVLDRRRSRPRYAGWTRARRVPASVVAAARTGRGVCGARVAGQAVVTHRASVVLVAAFAAAVAARPRAGGVPVVDGACGGGCVDRRGARHVVRARKRGRAPFSSRATPEKGARPLFCGGGCVRALHFYGVAS